MASQEKREFDKYLKFLTFKAVQVIVQSRQGRRIATKSSSLGNEWFNLAITDDKQVTSELKRSLEGRLPQPGQPVCVEILMDTLEGDTIVLEIWRIELDHSRRDVSVSVAHLLYPRLSLMLRSLLVISRTTPAYRLSRSHEENLTFTFRLYTSAPDITSEGFKHITCASTSCPYGTVSISLLYLHTITLPDRPFPERETVKISPHSLTSQDCYDSPSLPHTLPHFPFTTHTSSHSSGRGSNQADHTPFSTILPRTAEAPEREESHDTLTSSEGGAGTDGDLDPASFPTADHEQDGYILVDLKHIKPTFATVSHVDDLGQLLQSCKEVPQLDMLSGENSMDLQAAMKLIDERTVSNDGQAKSVDLS